MCFLTKKQNANFDADEKPKAAAEKFTPASTTAKGSPATLVSTDHHGRGKGPQNCDLAESVKAGIEEAGGSATLYQVPGTLSAEVLAKMYAPARPAYPIITPDELRMESARAFPSFTLPPLSSLFSPSGTPPPPFSPPAPSPENTLAPSLRLRALGAGKSTLTHHDVLDVPLGYAYAFKQLTGLEVHGDNTLTHHGVLYVPLGYAHAFKQLTGLEVHGDKFVLPFYLTPWRAAADGSRQPTALELDLVRIQGKAFCGVVNRVKF
ncbi:NADH-quinone oxidoreductase [Mycena leptocephala]|nr:NADH-quinone oxidoreductase [Mycena leptocephala]